MTDKTKALLLDLREVLKKHNAYIKPCSDEFGDTWLDVGFENNYNDGVELELNRALDVECIEVLLNK